MQTVLHVGPKYTRKISQTKSFFQTACGAHSVWKKRFNDFMNQVFLAYLGYNLSEIYIGNIQRRGYFLLRAPPPLPPPPLFDEAYAEV